jgi:hypothetical protein
VAKQANGDIKITIRELSDPSGLQSTLRADGVPGGAMADRVLSEIAGPRGRLILVIDDRHEPT